MANNVFYFNPTCELAVANGSFSYMPPRLLRDFEMDCSVLPFVFGDAKDYLLTERKPSQEFVNQWRDAGFELPAFCSLKEILSEKDLESITPWGWSPSTHFILKDLKDKCCSAFKESPVFNWKEEHKVLFERKTSLNFLENLLEAHPSEFFIEKTMTGVQVHSTAEIENLLKNHPAWVLKAPMSSSGRGIQMIRKSSLNKSNKQWISGVINQQKYLVAEPFLDKLADLSFQFKITAKGVPEYLGFSVFETNTNGQYKSTLIHSNNGSHSFSGLYRKTQEMITITAELLTHHLKHSVYSLNHRGFLGIDALIYKDQDKIKMQPCIEINSRMNMGILTMELEKHIHPESFGKFELFYGNKGEYLRFATQKAHEHPLIMKNGKINSGFLSLVDADETKQFGASILLANTR